MPIANFAGILLALALSMGSFSYSFSSQTDASGEAYVTIKANGSLPPLQVTITGDRQKINKSVPAMKNGQEFVIKWNQSSNKAAYHLKIVGKNLEGEADFEVARTAGGKMGQVQAIASLDEIRNKRTVSYQANFEVESYEFKVYNNSGDVAYTDNQEGKIAAGEKITLNWDTSDPVFLLEFNAKGNGVTGGYNLCPWSVELPHVDVNFDSGKAKIKPNEAPKIDRAAEAAIKELAALERINQAVNANLQAKLYIIGFTDTVGPAGKNQKLSQKRAKAIAEYFYKKGIWAEIYYAGMGERGLKVQTPDNTDEVRNRRAVYLLTANQPSPGGAIPSKWQKLAGARPRPANVVVPANATLSSDDGHSDADGSSSSGGGGSNPDTAPADEGDGSPDDLSEGSGEWGDALSNDPNPPAIEEEPGATKKGCRVDVDAPSGAGVTAMLAILFGLVRRRRNG